MLDDLIKKLEYRKETRNGDNIPMYVTLKEMRAIIVALKMYNAYEEVLDNELGLDK